MKKYRICVGHCFPRPQIEAVTIDRETDEYIWTNGRKQAKRSESYNYFDTFEEAKTALIKLAENKSKSIKKQLYQAKCCIGRIRNIKAS